MNRDRIQSETKKIRETAGKGGYQMHPDEAFVEGLVEGILTNRDRYGYDSCPCRLATGDADKDRSIVCPCDFRDDDLADFAACFCALYVSDGYKGDDNPYVPDRWDPEAAPADPGAPADAAGFSAMAAQVCTVCGYMAVKGKPPRRCPVCGASHDRFQAVRIAVSRD